MEGPLTASTHWRPLFLFSFGDCFIFEGLEYVGEFDVR